MNEITGWTKSSTSVGTIAYDAAGQMTQNDRYRYVYDGFGRLVALKDASGNPIATYGYNGLGFRIWEQPNGGDKRFFCYDERWRIVATFDDTNATPTRRVIHHAAGLAGTGGSLYIDSVILEDANDDTADVNLETRYYPLQNWRADVVCVGKLNDEDFQLVEVVDYDTYGNALSRPAVSADFDHDGGVTGSDLSDFFTAHGNGDPEADADLSGGITNDDIGVFYAAYEAGIYGPSRGACVNSGVIAGYAGYVRDRFAQYGELYHVRHRVYDTRMGTWTKRDPLGYVDGMGLYQYCSALPLRTSDWLGLQPAQVLPLRDVPNIYPWAPGQINPIPFPSQVTPSPAGPPSMFPGITPLVPWMNPLQPGGVIPNAKPQVNPGVLKCAEDDAYYLWNPEYFAPRLNGILYKGDRELFCNRTYGSKHASPPACDKMTAWNLKSIDCGKMLREEEFGRANFRMACSDCVLATHCRQWREGDLEWHRECSKKNPRTGKKYNGWANPDERSRDAHQDLIDLVSRCEATCCEACRFYGYGPVDHMRPLP